GARGALNGALLSANKRDDSGEEVAATIMHHVPMYYVPILDAGRIGIEYWVLGAPTKSNRRPTATYVNPNRPIVLTLLGQNQAELPISIIRKDAELPLLAYRVVGHVNCDH